MLRLQKRLLSLLRDGGASALPSSPLTSLHRHLCATATATATTSADSPFSVQDYLVNTCGLTRAQSLKASRSISHLRSPSNPDAVRAFLSDLGLSSSDIAAVVAADPKFLCSKVDATLAPRVAKLRELGLSPSKIARLVLIGAPALRSCDVASRLQFWIPLFGSFDELVQAVSRGALVRACTRCGEIGHSTSTHGLSCSSCDEYHEDGECRLSQVKCFLCESQDHYLARCPWNSILTEAFQGQRENFQAALRLALSKQGNPSSRPTKCSAKSEGKVMTANKSSPICFTCREEGHFAFQCPQNSPGQFEKFEESSTIATSSNLSKELEERDPGTRTAKQSSEMKPILYDRCCPSKAKVLSPNKSSPTVRTCKTKTQGKKRICFTCREEGHFAFQCPQNSPGHFEKFEESSTIATSSNLSKELEGRNPGTVTAKQSSEMKPKSKVRCVRCGEEGHRRKRCPLRYQSLTMYTPSLTADNTPTGVLTCFRCKEEGHYARQCPQKHQKC